VVQAVLQAMLTTTTSEHLDLVIYKCLVEEALDAQTVLDAVPCFDLEDQVQGDL